MKTSPKRSKLNDISISTRSPNNKTFTNLLTALQPKPSDFSDNERSISSSDILPLSSPTTTIMPNHFSHRSTRMQVYEVQVQDLEFQPKRLPIFEGCMVRWNIKENKSSHQSGIYSATNRSLVIGIPDLDVESDLLSKGESFEYTFLKAGTYEIVCANYPRMKSTIEVQKEQTTHYSHKILEEEIRNKGLWKNEQELEDFLKNQKSKSSSGQNMNQRIVEESPPSGSLDYFESDDLHTDILHADPGVKELIKELNQSGQKPKTPYPKNTTYEFSADTDEDHKSGQLNFSKRLYYECDDSRELPGDDSRDFSDNGDEGISDFFKNELPAPAFGLGIDQAEKKGLISSPLLLHDETERAEEERLIDSIKEIEFKTDEAGVRSLEVDPLWNESPLMEADVKIENRDNKQSHDIQIERNKVEDVLKSIREEVSREEKQIINEKEKENIVEPAAPKKKAKKNKKKTKKRTKTKLEQNDNLQIGQTKEASDDKTENSSITDLDKIVKFQDETHEAQMKKEEINNKSASLEIEMKEIKKKEEPLKPLTKESDKLLIQNQKPTEKEVSNAKESIKETVQAEMDTLPSKEGKKNKKKRNRKKGAAVTVIAATTTDRPLAEVNGIQGAYIENTQELEDKQSGENKNKEISKDNSETTKENMNHKEDHTCLQFNLELPIIETESFYTFIKRTTSEYVENNKKSFRSNKDYKEKRKESDEYDEEELEKIESLKAFLSNRFEYAEAFD